MSDKVMAEFKAWYLGDEIDGFPFGGSAQGYAWAAWQASRRAALDEVAAVMAFYAEPDNYRRQPVVEETMGANVPVDCQDPDAHAREACAKFAATGFHGAPEPSDIPHVCRGTEDGPKRRVVVLTEPKMWGTPPVLVDGGSRARTLAQGGGA